MLSPFAGIGSEGYVSRRFGRKFIGIELKQSYFDIAVKHLAQANEEGLRDPTVPNDLPEKKAVKPRKSKATAVAPPLAVSEPSVVAVAATAMEASST